MATIDPRTLKNDTHTVSTPNKPPLLARLREWKANFSGPPSPGLIRSVSNGWDSLHQCAYQGDTLHAQRCTQYLPVDAKTQLGWTALHIAILTGDASMVSMLLEAGADPNATDNYGWSALHFVVLGPVLNRTRHEFKYLYLPAKRERKVLFSFRRFLAAWELPSFRNGAGYLQRFHPTRIHGAPSLCWFKNGGASIAKLLMARGANALVQNDAGKTPLDLLPLFGALAWENDAIFLALVLWEGILHQTPADQRDRVASIGCAVRSNGCVGLIWTLLFLGENPNAVFDGKQVLQWACWNKNYTVAKLLALFQDIFFAYYADSNPMDMPETRAQIDYTPIEYHLNPYRNTVENVWLSMSKIDGDDEASKASVDSWLHALEYTPPYKPLYEGRMISTGWYKDLVRFATSYQLHECLKRLKYWYPQNKNYVWPPDWGPDAYDKIKAIYMGTNTRSRVPFKGKHKDYAMTQGENGRFLDDITATATTTTASPFPSSMAMCSEETLQLDPFSRQCHICNVSLTQRYWYQRETNHRNIYAKTGIGPPPKSQYPTRSYSPPPPPPEPRRTDCNCETGFTNSRLVHVESAGQRRERERSAAEQRYREDKEGRARERERRDRARSEERRQAYANRPYDYGGGGNGE